MMFEFNGSTILIIVGVIVLLWVIATWNKFVRLSKEIERGESVVDVFLKKRFDLIPNLVETVKGYIKHEKETLKEVTELRTKFNENHDVKAGEKLQEHYTKLIAVIESYPEIKASENFLHLQKSLSKVESEIQAARRILINNITTYNTKVQTIPSSIIAMLFGYKAKELPKYNFDEVNIKF